MSNSLAHPDQANPGCRAAKGSVKTPAIISDAKTNATRVRSKFNMCVLSLTMFSDVAKRFLRNAEKTQGHICRDHVTKVALGETNFNVVLLGKLSAEASES